MSLCYCWPAAVVCWPAAVVCWPAAVVAGVRTYCWQAVGAGIPLRLQLASLHLLFSLLLLVNLQLFVRVFAAVDVPISNFTHLFFQILYVSYTASSTSSATITSYNNITIK